MDEKTASAPTAGEDFASPLLSASRLIDRLGDAALRVLDARFELLEPGAGAEMYAAGHVPGAVRLDLDSDMAAPPGIEGRHPLPDLEVLARRLGRLGVGDEHEVVVYDQTGSMYAARAWWLLRYMGHDAVRFLDGGLGAYLAAGGPITTAEPSHEETEFRLDVRHEMVIELDELVSRLDDDGLVLLDARSPERYRGETEPLDPKAGHIPGAINRHYVRSSGANGMLPPTELREVLRLNELPAGAEVVAYCGSGVSAAHLVLALEAAGRRDVKLYPGSWSEWSRNAELPVAVGEEG